MISQDLVRRRKPLVGLVLLGLLLAVPMSAFAQGPSDADLRNSCQSYWAKLLPADWEKRWQKSCACEVKALKSFSNEDRAKVFKARALSNTGKISMQEELEGGHIADQARTIGNCKRMSDMK